MRKKGLLVLLLFLALAIFAGMLIFENPEPVMEVSSHRAATSFSSFQESLTAYTISKGQHFCFPRIFRSRNRPESVSWRIRFASNCNYDLQDNDQKDWNKLCGLFFNLFNTRDNTVMVGWRWNTDTERMELCAYYHVDGSREFTRPLLDLALEEELTVIIQIDYQHKEYKVLLERSSDGKRMEHAKAFAHDRETCWEINTYFGGNRTAPQDLTVYKGYLE